MPIEPESRCIFAENFYIYYMRNITIQTKKRLCAAALLIVVSFADMSLATTADLLTLLWYVHLLWKQEEKE